MKYYEAEFTISPISNDTRDIVAALAGEAGFETFEETAVGLKGYVQQTLFDEVLLRQMLDACPLPDVTVSYTIREAEDRDWNEQWEQEGFEPIIVDNRLVIHDGRHLPDITRQPSPITQIEIDAHLAFGTGTHETTRMMCASLLDLFSHHSSSHTYHPRELDCGTGTGILAITALKLGASDAVGYDIDEWSADNARHNAVINGVGDLFTSLLGDASILNKVEGRFDIVTANINRNILLADMPAFVSKMAPGATLLLSGFYTEDIPLLVAKAEELGMSLDTKRDDNNWACISFVKSEE